MNAWLRNLSKDLSAKGEGQQEEQSSLHACKLFMYVEARGNRWKM